MRPDQTLLVISQVYVPDPAAVGQQMHDAAAEMARRGHRVVVLTSGRGYEDPTRKYPRRERRDGVEIVRLPFSSFGKRTILLRLLGQMLFLLQCIMRGLFTRRLGAILVSTSPPFASIAALAIHALRRTPIKFWLMDLNPDQAVALGKVKHGSLPVRAFDWLNRRLLAAADDVVVLDRFMAQRLSAKGIMRRRMTVLPPWAHEEHLSPVAHGDNPFRQAQGWQGKFVFMYSGNMSIASPLTTIVQAALLLRDEPRLHFAFIGGGLGKREVEQVIAQHRPANITCLPYQPLHQLKYSLSAADVHLVTLGDNMVGIIHPCKIYGAMAVARPVLYVGPRPSHVSDLLDQHRIGWQGEHGQVEALVDLLRQIAATEPDQLTRMGQAGRAALAEDMGQARLCGTFAEVLER
ncbi:MAG: glycosyltransferase family 4 protein [Phycisphaeraceae bacterium]